MVTVGKSNSLAKNAAHAPEGGERIIEIDNLNKWVWRLPRAQRY